MCRRGLRGGIGELSGARALHRTGDRRDVDNRRGVSRGFASTLSEQRQESHRHVKDAANICLEGVGPGLRRRLQEVIGDGLRIFPIRLASSGELCIVVTCNSCVIDQELDTSRFFIADLLV